MARHIRISAVAIGALIAVAGGTPARSAVEVRAVRTGLQTITFDGRDGYAGGPVGVRARMAVNLFYGAYAPGGPAIGGNNIAGWLDIDFTIAEAAVRDYYPTLDPDIRYFNTREGAAFAGLLDNVRVSLGYFSPDAGRDIALLDIVSTAPTANFGIFDFQTLHTNGRGLKLAHDFGGAEQHRGFLQAGDCHDPACNNQTADDFTIASEILDLGRTIQPNSFRGFYLQFSDADAGFTDSATTPFTVPFLNFAFVSAVPEPQAWTLLILGFGTIGATMRRQRRRKITL